MSASLPAGELSPRKRAAAGPSFATRLGLPPLGPRMPWLLGYVVINLVAVVMMIYSGYLMGDAAELRVARESDLWIAYAITLAIYLLVAVALFRFMTRLTFFRLTAERSDARRAREAAIVGTFLLVLQIAFLFFNLREGINVAGSTNLTTDSKLNILFVLLQPDIFFFVYYGYYRESRLFKYNLGVFVISNFLRGWSGFLLTIAFFEWCRAYRNGRLRSGPVFVAGLLALLAYPALLAVKWYIRLNPGATFGDLQAMFQAVNEAIGAEAYLEVVLGGVTHIVERLQSVSIVAGIMQTQGVLQAQLASGQVTPFWWEGLPQLALLKGFGATEAPTLGVMLTDVIAHLPSADFGSWSISPGLAGWIVLEPLWTPFLAIYVLGLCFLSVVLAPGCHREGGVRDMLWYSWLVYLIPGWIMAFTGVICALAVLSLIRAVLWRV